MFIQKSGLSLAHGIHKMSEKNTKNKVFNAPFVLFIDNNISQVVGYFQNIRGIGHLSNETNFSNEINLCDGKLDDSFERNKDFGSVDIKICFYDEKNNPMTYVSGVASKLNCINIGDTVEIILEGEGLPFIEEGALSLWNSRRKSFPRYMDEWVNFDVAKRKIWLDVSLLDQRKNTVFQKGSKLEIDGELVGDKVSFLCAFGEAVFGPGGYMGKNLDALEDCLSRELAFGEPVTLLWKNLENSKYSFEANDEIAVYEELLEILSLSNVKIIF
jgi:RNAse (barnase) inhibitor barstar